MKNPAIICLLFISVLSFSQTKEGPLNIKKSKLKEVKLLSELISDMPKETVILSTEISARYNGGPIESTGTSDTLNEVERKVLFIADVNSNIKVDIKYIDKKTPTEARTRTYNFLIVE